MGYTHYWRHGDLDQAKWDEFARRAKLLIEASDVPVVWEYDEPKRKPEITGLVVRFNGVGEDGHETFYFQRQPRHHEWEDKSKHPFNFTKTARKPYDEICVAILIEAERIFGEDFSWSSDGEGERGYKKAGLALIALIDQQLQMSI